MPSLRVATLNIWNKSGPWVKRAALIREQLASLSPDIVGLQEVLQMESGGQIQDQVTELSGDYEWCFGMGHIMKGSWAKVGSTLRFGNALLSRYPILRHEAIPLPGDDISDQKRSVLHAVVDAPFGHVHVFVTHLNWKLDEGHVRELQVQAIADLVADRCADVDFPPLLMGDMNAVPESDEIRFLKGYTRLGRDRSVHFADAWDYVPGSDPGRTFDARVNGFSASYEEPPRRIDYVFVRPPFVHGRGRPVEVGLAFHAPAASDPELHCSDHFGVYADLHLPD